MWSVKYRPNPGSARISPRRSAAAGAGLGVRANCGLMSVRRYSGAPMIGRPTDALRNPAA